MLKKGPPWHFIMPRKPFSGMYSDIAIVIHFEVDTKSEWHRKEKCDVHTRGFVVFHFSISIILRKFL